MTENSYSKKAYGSGKKNYDKENQDLQPLKQKNGKNMKGGEKADWIILIFLHRWCMARKQKSV